METTKKGKEDNNCTAKDKRKKLEKMSSFLSSGTNESVEEDKKCIQVNYKTYKVDEIIDKHF